jgi:hypothetical protein
MTVQEHLKLAGAMSVAALPWLKEDVWIPFASSVLIDVDHYVWHAVTRRTLSLRAAARYFGQADPPQPPAARLLHHPLTLGSAVVAAAASRSRTLRLIVAGLLFHGALDAVHAMQMSRLKRQLAEGARGICQDCGRRNGELQLHTVRVTGNPLDRYSSRHFLVLCPSCHKRAHGEI